MAAAMSAAAAHHAVKAGKKKQEDQLVDADIQAVFNKYDVDGSGDIDGGELRQGLKDLGLNVNENQIERILIKYGTGTDLNIDTFQRLVGDLRVLRSRAIAKCEQEIKTAAEEKRRRMSKAGKCCHPVWKLPYQDEVQAFYQNQIVVVTVAMFIMGNFFVNMIEKEIDPRSLKYPETWESLDVFFNIIFLIELLVNMYGCGGPFSPFWSSGWNVFDTIIVTVGVVLMTGVDLGNFNKLKLLRAFRVFRLFKRIKSLNKIIVSLIKAIPGVANAFVIMIIFFAIYAILAVELFIDFGEGECSTDADAMMNGTCVSWDAERGEYLTTDENSTIVNSAMTPRGYTVGFEYYGTFFRALYTLFQVMTGESWSEAVARPLLFGLYQANAFVVGFYFVSFLILTQIVLSNVVVAVLLDKMVEPEEVDTSIDPYAAEINISELLHQRGLDIAEQLATDPSKEPALSTENTTPRGASPPSGGGTGLEGKMELLLSEMATMRREIAELRASTAASPAKKSLAA